MMFAVCEQNVSSPPLR